VFVIQCQHKEWHTESVQVGGKAIGYPAAIHFGLPFAERPRAIDRRKKVHGADTGASHWMLDDWRQYDGGRDDRVGMKRVCAGRMTETPLCSNRREDLQWMG